MCGQYPYIIGRFLAEYIIPYILFVFIDRIEKKENEIILEGPPVVVQSDKGMEYIPLDEYLCGVMAPYMEAGYTTEELEFLSLIYRSNLIYDMEKGRTPLQEYYTREERQNLFLDFEKKEEQLRIVIAQTAGDILIYKGKIMEIPMFEFGGMGLTFEEILEQYYEDYTLYHYY